MHVIQQPLILLMLHLCYTLATLVLHSCYTQTGDLTNVKQPPLILHAAPYETSGRW